MTTPPVKAKAKAKATSVKARAPRIAKPVPTPAPVILRKLTPLQEAAADIRRIADELARELEAINPDEPKRSPVQLMRSAGLAGRLATLCEQVERTNRKMVV